MYLTEKEFLFIDSKCRGLRHKYEEVCGLSALVLVPNHYRFGSDHNSILPAIFGLEERKKLPLKVSGIFFSLKVVHLYTTEI